MSPTDRLLNEGFELLGEVQLSDTVALGDPAALPTPPGLGAWRGLAIRPGAWLLFGRPWVRDRDQLEEVVAVRSNALERFYELYDGADDQGELPARSGRVALVDGPRREEVALLESLLEPDADALPWVTDAAAVFATIAGANGRLLTPPGPVVALFSMLLAPPLGGVEIGRLPPMPPDDDTES